MSGETEFIDNLKYEIQTEYLRSENRLGWRFIYSPVHVLEAAEVAFIGLNPGGSEVDPNHAGFAMNAGSAYRDEHWPDSSKLQAQVLALFKRLKAEPEDVLAGNLVPFRSPSWDTLKNREASLRFGRRIWANVLDRVRPSVVVSMGGHANQEVSQMLGVKHESDYPVGWGQYKATRGQYDGGTWIGLPHLSRFTIMEREASRDALDLLFDGVGR